MPDFSTENNPYMLQQVSMHDYEQQIKHAQEAQRLRTEALAAWSPPIMYDNATGKSRLVTMEDVKLWQQIENAYEILTQAFDRARGYTNKNSGA